MFLSQPVNLSLREINEELSRGHKIRDLQSLETYLSDKRLPYSEIPDITRCSSADELARVSILFSKSQSSPAIPDSNTLILRYYKKSSSYGDSSQTPTLRVEASLSKNDVTLMFGESRKQNGSDFKNLDEVVKLCDSETIYRNAFPFAKDILYRVNTYCYYSLDLVDESPRQVDTFAVSYNPQTQRYCLMHNSDFLLNAALDMWAANESKFESLSACYLYTLVFLLYHEMLHISLSNCNVSDAVDSGEAHSFKNIAWDSYINCQVVSVLGRNSLLKPGNEFSAPVISGTIGTGLKLRSEINNGFIRMVDENTTQEEFKVKLLKILRDMGNILIPRERSELAKPEFRFDLQYIDYFANSPDVMEKFRQFSGANFLISVDIPANSPIRASATLIERSVSAALKCISDGKCVFFTESPSALEIMSCQKNLDPGTLVKIYRMAGVYIVDSVDDKNIHHLCPTEREVVSSKENGITTYTEVFTPKGEVTQHKARAFLSAYTPSVTAFNDNPEEEPDRLSAMDLLQVATGKNSVAENCVDALFKTCMRYGVGDSAERLLQEILNDSKKYNVTCPTYDAQSMMQDVAGKDDTYISDTYGKSTLLAIQKATEKVRNDGYAREHIDYVNSKENNSEPPYITPSAPNTTPPASDSYPGDSGKPTPTFSLNSYVWIPGLHSYGIITAYNPDTGKVTVEACEELEATILDDSDNHNLSSFGA